MVEQKTISVHKDTFDTFKLYKIEFQSLTKKELSDDKFLKECLTALKIRMVNFIE